MQSFHPFELERWMSKFERAVDYNLSESGVHPVRLEELAAQAPGAMDELMATPLDYPHVNGIPGLRQNIAALYPGADPGNVLVTVGAIEANYISIQTLLAPGDEIVIMMPNYMQIWGVAKNRGLSVKTFRLLEDRGWAPDLDELGQQVTERTRLVAVCNPNNPTGRVLTGPEMDTIVAAADRAGAWILADEVYRGAERETDTESPTFYGRYDKVLAVGSLSKAYGLPGLRVGWVCGPVDVIDDIWARHEYTTIAATMLSNHLAAIALSPEVRPRLLARTRGYIRRGFPVLKAWMDRHGDLFQLTPPDAAAIAFVRYRLDIGSTDLTERLRQEKSVLVVPGDHFGLDRLVRLSFGLPEDYLEPALERFHQLIVDLG